MPLEYKVSHFFNNPAYLTEITELERVSFANPWNDESLSTELTNPINLTSVIKPESAVNAKIAGYSLTRIISPEAELLKVAVFPEVRGRGVATKMLNSLQQQLQSLQIEKVYLEVSEKNQPAIVLYQKVGFSKAGYRPNYYDKGTTGAFIFCRYI